MSLKFINVIIFLLASAPCFSQTARIDSVFIDEGKGEIVLLGSFPNIASRIVLVDSIELPVIFSSTSSITAKILDTGRGSCGPVSVSINGIKSNEKTITYFHFRVQQSWRHHYSDGTDEGEFVESNIHIRLILDGQNTIDENLIPTKLSFYHITASGHNGIHGGIYSGANYDSTVALERIIVYSPKNRSFYFSYWIPDHYTKSQISESISIELDPHFQIKHYHLQGYPGNSSDCNDFMLQAECIDVNYIKSTDFPPNTSGVNNDKLISKNIKTELISNPVKKVLKCNIYLNDAREVKIKIVDILGNTIQGDELELQAGINRLNFDLANLSPGIYILRCQSEDEVESIKFIIDKH
jgi:hypothetical protein